MRHWNAVGAAIAMCALSCAVAHADPVVPQPDGPCAAELDGAMTVPTGERVPLVCANARWEPVTDPYPISEKWVSDGPSMTLHGQGRPNPNLLSGAWTATPLDPESVCSATQAAVIPGSPTVGPPQIDRAPAGRPLTFDVVPILFTIEMSGDCLWQKES